MTVISVGLVSFGVSGRVFHAPFLLANPNFNLIAVYERSKNYSEEFCSKWNHIVQVVRSIEELCAISSIELIIVCSPIEFHFDHASVALTAGKHVLVEKAFVQTSRQAKLLLQIANERNLICVPYQNRRFDADFLTLQNLIRSNVFGRVVEYNGFYNRWSPTLRMTSWKDTVKGSGGNFLSLGSHMIDQAICMFSRNIIGMKKTFPNRIWAYISIQRDNGLLDDDWEVHLYYDNYCSASIKPSSNDRDCSNSSTSIDSDVTGVHGSSLKVILKGSLLCMDHSIRYMVHGTNGSWVKIGVDNQESILMLNTVLPPFRELHGGCQAKQLQHEQCVKKLCSGLVITETEFSAKLKQQPENDESSPATSTNSIASTCGVDDIKFWGKFTCSGLLNNTGADGANSCSSMSALSKGVYYTPSEHGSYHYLYNNLYDCITNRKNNTNNKSNEDNNNDEDIYITSQEAYAVIRLIELAYDSSRTGCVISIPDNEFDV